MKNKIKLFLLIGIALTIMFCIIVPRSSNSSRIIFYSTIWGMVGVVAAILIDKKIANKGKKDE
jgi:ABC-type lipoprotein release transport system permease subunit